MPPDSGLQYVRTERVEAILLAILLAFIPLRASIQETHTFETPELTRRIDAPAGPTPVHTLVLSGVIFGAGVILIAARIARGGPAWRWTGGEIGIGLILLAGLLTFQAASAKRLAINGLADLAGVLAWFVLLQQLLQRPWQVRLALCVLLATGCTVAVKCIQQRYDDYPATLKHYNERIAPQLDRGPGPSDAGRRYDFEQRLRSMAATGYFAHANVAATVLATMVVAAVGVGLTRRRQSPLGWRASLAPLAVAGLAAFALALTQSKGAAAAAAIGLVGLAAALRGSAWLNRHRRGALVGFWLIVLAGGAGVVGYGLASGGLPSRSMLFRWMYWRGAAEMYREHPWGVGYEQFGRYFPRYKPVECPEEVQDPHSWIVRAATELGPVGLAGFVLLWVGVSIALVRTGSAETPERRAAQETGRPAPSPPQADRGGGAMTGSKGGMPSLYSAWACRAPEALGGGSEAFGGAMLGWMFAVVAPAMLALIAINFDSLERGDAAAALMLNTIQLATAWCVAFALLSIESREPAVFRGESAAALRPVLIAAACVFLLHASIDLALFLSGAATLLFGLLAAALAAGDGSSQAIAFAEPPFQAREVRRRRAMRMLATGTVGLAVYGWVCVRPPLRAGAAIEQARDLLRRTADEPRLFEYANLRYQAAAAADYRDGTAGFELMEEMVRRADSLLRSFDQCDRAISRARSIAARDPASGRGYGLLARLEEHEYRVTGYAGHLGDAAADMSGFVRHYPTSPERRLAYGRLLAEWSELLAASDNESHRKYADSVRRDAIEQLELALELDRRRIYVSPPHHLSAEVISAVKREIERLRG